MRMAGLPQTSLIATSSRGRTVLLLMTINPDGPSITPHGPGLPWQRVVIDHPGDLLRFALTVLNSPKGLSPFSPALAAQAACAVR
jgi:hypothetical protein